MSSLKVLLVTLKFNLHRRGKTFGVGGVSHEGSSPLFEEEVLIGILTFLAPLKIHGSD